MNERRSWTISGLDVRAASDDTGPLIVGHAAVFNSPSLDLGGFREIVAPGAFKRSLKAGGPIKSFFNHDPSYVLGRTDNGTLAVREDKDGLEFEVQPPDTQWARDLMTSLRRGDVADASFAFAVREDAWTEKDGVQVRTLLDVELYELGPVTNGAYPAADSQVRALLESRNLKLSSGTVEPSHPPGRYPYRWKARAALVRLRAG